LRREEGDSALFNLVHERFGGINPHPEINRHAVTTEALMLLVALGTGVTLVSEPIANIPYAGVIFRPLAAQKNGLIYSAIWLPENDNPASRRFLSLMRTTVAQNRSAASPAKHS
jgi:DNA-binding transcriptional LysR family regulator